MEKSLIDLVKGINLSNVPIAAIKFESYEHKMGAFNSKGSSDCVDCNCDCVCGYCLE
jgi:hypothetical protein